jgi:hypothetical protein
MKMSLGYANGFISQSGPGYDDEAVWPPGPVLNGVEERTFFAHNPESIPDSSVL